MSTEEANIKGEGCGRKFGLAPGERGIAYSVAEARGVVLEQLKNDYHQDIFLKLIEAYEQTCERLEALQKSAGIKKGMLLNVNRKLIHFNGTAHTWNAPTVRYQDVVTMCDEKAGALVTYVIKYPDGTEKGGTLSERQEVEAVDGMRINCYNTGKA